MITFTSIANEDGFVGAPYADGPSATRAHGRRQGFDNTDTYRTILSFDTSALPDDAATTGARLRLTRASHGGR